MRRIRFGQDEDVEKIKRLYNDWANKRGALLEAMVRLHDEMKRYCSNYPEQKAARKIFDHIGNEVGPKTISGTAGNLLRWFPDWFRNPR